MVRAMTDNRNTGENPVDFSLQDQNAMTFRLSEHLGKKVLLSFHPLAWTSICARQMKSLEDNKANFSSLNSLAVGISIDSVPCKKAWAESLGIVETPLLADFWPHGKVAQLYGIFREKEGFSERANIILDEHGRIAFSRIYELKQLPDLNEIINLLRG